LFDEPIQYLKTSRQPVYKLLSENNQEFQKLNTLPIESFSKNEQIKIVIRSPSEIKPNNDIK